MWSSDHVHHAVPSISAGAHADALSARPCRLEAAKEAVAETGWWSSASFWGAAGAIAGWGMTGAAIYDASTAGPEIISLNMTSVSPRRAFLAQLLS